MLEICYMLSGAHHGLWRGETLAVTVENIDRDFVPVAWVDIGEPFSREWLEVVYYIMQGEVWSPNGEARDIVEECAVWHTSMTVGDLVIDQETGEVWVVADFGFHYAGRVT